MGRVARVLGVEKTPKVEKKQDVCTNCDNSGMTCSVCGVGRVV